MFYVISASSSPNLYCDILHLYNNIVIPIINSVTSVKPDMMEAGMASRNIVVKCNKRCDDQLLQ